MKQIDNKTIFLGVAVVVGLIVTYLVSSYAIPKAMVTLTKAAPAMVASIPNSYLLGAKVLAKADGKDKNTVNVFVLDKNGKGVEGKSVVLEAEGVTISPPQAISNNDGKATFNVVSTEEKQVEMTAIVEGIPLAKTLRVTFRN